MPRYEFKEGKSSKFWEIELDEESFTTRWGRIGTAGQESTKDFDTRADAKKEYQKLIAEKVKKGYVLVSGEGGDAPAVVKSNPGLEAQIEAAPDDLHTYEVYADWLQSSGDARGELIAVQIGLSKSPASELTARQQELLGLNDGELFHGSLQSLLGSSISLTWRYGFFDVVRISLGYDEAEEADLDELVTTAMTHPSGRFLRALTIGMFDYEGENHYKRLVATLLKCGPKPTLRALYLGDFEFPEETEISWAEVGDIGKLWALYPNLEQLTLQGGNIGLGKVVAPKLRSLTLRTGGLPRRALQSLAAASFPSLERLEIWTGSDSYGGDSQFKDLAPLLSGGSLPKLTHLGIANCAYVGEVVRALMRSNVLGQIQSLDLSKGALTDDDATTLLENKALFGRLSSLDLSENLLSGEMAGRLTSLCEHVNASDQRPDDPEYRYVAVGE
ncbi:MAG: WGR domain-containing protein [Polyangiaceae bacterium]|nr:WGR domain-containing protein [Polyangiaceae bacterium]